MESMGKKPRRRRSFTPEFKAEIVGLCQQGDRSVGQRRWRDPRPSVFQAGHIPSWRGSCESYALSAVAAVSGGCCQRCAAAAVAVTVAACVAASVPVVASQVATNRQ